MSRDSQAMIVTLCVSCYADRTSYAKIPWDEREIVLMHAAPSAGVKGGWKRVLASEKFQIDKQTNRQKDIQTNRQGK